jgi:ketosteroid isomerase-like protein
MPGENVEIVRRGYDAWNRGNEDAWISMLHPEVEFQTAQLFSDTEAVYHGQEGMRKFWDRFRAAWESVLVEVDRIEPIGDDRVLALFWFRAVGRGSGAEVRVQYANLFKIDQGALRRCIGFSDWNEALKAAGLSD